jgi:hypothetical protein
MLVHQLPQKPTNIRVKTWRRLQALGAVSIKNSVYILPHNEKTNEDFQWLRQEIESMGGEASLFRAGSVEGATDAEIVALFCRDRDEEYSKLITEFEGILGAARRQNTSNSLSVGKLAEYEAELIRLQHELERVAANDFFGASQRSKARAAFERCRRMLRSNATSQNSRAKLQKGSAILKISDYQKRQWVTRKDPHIDRLASAWLIRQFIDKHPRFYFVSENESVGNKLSFDMAEGDFTHQGEDCTFETMTKQFGLDGDPALKQIAEIVHDIDLKDNKFKRPEASGINCVIRGLSVAYPNDGERLRQSVTVFESLYELFRDLSDNRSTRKNAKGKYHRGRK